MEAPLCRGRNSNQSAAPGARGSRRPNETGDGALAPHFRLLELSGGNRPVESGALICAGG